MNERIHRDLRWHLHPFWYFYCQNTTQSKLPPWLQEAGNENSISTCCPEYLYLEEFLNIATISCTNDKKGNLPNPQHLYTFSDFPPVGEGDLSQLQRPCTDASVQQIFPMAIPTLNPGHVTPALSPGDQFSSTSLYHSHWHTNKLSSRQTSYLTECPTSKNDIKYSLAPCCPLW